MGKKTGFSPDFCKPAIATVSKNFWVFWHLCEVTLLYSRYALKENQGLPLGSITTNKTQLWGNLHLGTPLFPENFGGMVKDRACGLPIKALILYLSFQGFSELANLKLWKLGQHDELKVMLGLSLSLGVVLEGICPTSLQGWERF